MATTRPSRRAAPRRQVIEDADDSFDAETIVSNQQVEDEEEFTPAPKRSPRRRTTAAVDASNIRPKSITTSRRARPTEFIENTIEPSTVFDPPLESFVEEAASPTKRAAPKRRSVKDAHHTRKSRTTRMSMASDVTPTQTALPTPEPSATPEEWSRQGTPLSDITETALNGRSMQTSVEPLTPKGTPSTQSSSIEVSEAAVVTMALVESDPMEGVEEILEALPTPKPIAVKRIDSNVTKLDRPMDIVIKKRTMAMPLCEAPVEPKARMTITYLILTNFKSYAGQQTIGPFHASFSSVVGPNGSGKSNVIDSLLFVFGFRASKMRQGKISALIHNSANFPDLDYCEVEVQFQMVMDSLNGAATTVVPDSQLTISRRAFKNNSSKYYIDGRTSDFTSVTTLLKGRGIDLDHKRFLILQGEVETIAQMKPKAAGEHDDGLLEYLEDIIGTSKYKTPIEEAAAETEALNDVCAEKSGRVQHVEREKNGLEDKRKKAMAFIHDENELTSKRSAYYQLGLAECNDNKRVTEEAIGRLEVELAEELERHRGAENDAKALETQYNKGTKERKKMADGTAEIQRRVHELDKVKAQIEVKRKHLNNKLKKLEKALEASKFGYHESETLAKQAIQDTERISGEIEELEQQMEAEERELFEIRESLKGKTQDLGDQIAAKQKQLEPWTTKISEKQSAVAVARSELDILRERESAGTTAVAEVQAKVQDLQEQSASKLSSIQDCEKRRKSAEKEIQSAHRRLDEVFRQVPTMEEKVSNARQKADEARASLSASNSQGDVLKALTQLSEQGRLEGFHGRLGNLGTIDAEYDVAISTACPTLDNLVVDTVDCATKCIAYLRKNNVGRGVFITLDKIAQHNLGPIDTPEGCPRLFDLVRSKHQRYRHAFYHALRDTLVASDSAQADRVAYGVKRWRVVSLDGKLVESSGVMSGGGTRVARGAMSSKVVADVTREQVIKLEGDRDSIEQNYAELRREQNDVETQIRDLEKQVPDMDTEAQKLSLERDSIERNISDAKNRIRELLADRQPAKSEKVKISGLETKIASMLSDIQNLQSETDSIETDITELQNKIMEIGGIKLRSQKAKVDGLREQIESLNERLITAETSQTKAKKQQVKHSQAMEDSSEEIDKVTGQIGEVDLEAQSQTRDDSGLRREAEEANQALEEKEDMLEDLKKQLDELTAELNENRGTEVELRKRIEDNRKHLDSNQKRLDDRLNKLSKLTLHNISEDGEEGEPEPVQELSRDEIEELDRDDLKAAIVRLEDKTSHNVDLSVLSEYRRRVVEHSNRLEDLNTALASRDQVKQRLDEFRRLRLEGFMEGYNTISSRLKEMYQLITRGGNAMLELVDSLDPFSEGILFSVMPPKKSWKNISNLSGGEKTLSSLALVFALHHYKPTPLYVMDEIDAALDFKNVSIVANYISERTKNAQFIVISLRNNMFELARRLVGVYKVNHMTKSVTVENRDYIVPLPQPAVDTPLGTRRYVNST